MADTVAGYHTFKWKIGVAAIQDELKIFQLLAKRYQC